MKKIGTIPTQISSSTQATENRPRGGRILYVEDEEDNVKVARLRLGREYQLLHAATDYEACRAFRDFGDDLVAILMDIQLSGSRLDGIQLTKLLRGTLPTDRLPSYARGLTVLRTPVIFVTAYNAKYSESEL